MVVSLRARLVALSSALLLVALIAFGGWVALSTWRGWLAEVDRGLKARLTSLSAALRPADDGFDLVLPANATADQRDYYAVWDGQGRLLVASDPDRAGVRPSPGTWRVGDLREHVALLDAGVTIMVGRRIDNLTAEINRLLLVMTGVGVAALALVVAGGWWLVGRALAPVTRIGVTAQAMIEGDLTARIPMSRVETELEAMAAVLNEAFDRLYASLERQRQFTADASHDLRTPLTTIQAETHWALAKPRTADEYQASLDVCRRAAVRMQDLVRSLLDLARAESVSGPERQPCVLADVVQAVLTDVEPVAQRRSVQVRTGPLAGTVIADPVSLRAAVTNLITNAIQYNVPGGTVDVAIETSPGQLTLSVRDTGIGLTPHDAARVFDRFYRADASRDRSTGGSGLGLAMVAAFARAHGGSASVDSAPGAGSTFRLTLPTQRS